MNIILDGVDLDTWRHVGHGGSRNVFAHPDHPDILLKTIKPSSQLEGGARRAKGWQFHAKKWRRFGAYMSFRRETEEFINQARQFPGRFAEKLPIAHVYGFTRTSQGLAMIVEKIKGEGDKLAPTLRELARSGRLEDEHRRLLDEFFDRCEALHIVLMDCGTANFVLAEERDGRPQIVCIDGAGEKSALGLYGISRYLNRMRLKRFRKKVLRGLERAAMQKPGSVEHEPQALRRPVAEASPS